jgi:hypothetical protein
VVEYIQGAAVMLWLYWLGMKVLSDLIF